MSEKGFIPRLESLRGLAALAVVIYHIWPQFSASSPTGWIDAILCRMIASVANGIGAVVIFFVLSGFVLARSLDRDPSAYRFLRNRVFRLLPAAITVVALLVFLHWKFGFFVGYETAFDPINVILNMLLVRSDINGPMWSLTIECVAIPLILVCMWLYQSFGQKPLWILITVLFSLSFWGPYVHLLGGFTNMAPFYAFVIGILVHFRGRDVVEYLGRRWGGLATASALALYWYFGSTRQPAPVLMLDALSAAVLIAVIVWQPGITIFNVLDWRIVRFYGRISYSLYLFHPLGLAFAHRMISPQSMNLPISLRAIVAAVLAIVFTTPIAWLSWKFVEVPAIRLGKRLAIDGHAIRARLMMRSY